ncbi:MAG: peptidoglycan DD-metalloendopeptidase family protein [Chloroflexi bacterium]|nr:peptidoglycan DD-metalloendopeptidase family protein [Chloroflexota bacterium]
MRLFCISFNRQLREQLRSFYAHLQNAVVNTTPGTIVTQGMHIADSGNTGTGGQNGGHHLHFEARSGCEANNVYSGTAIPIRPLMGNWWNSWYAPPSASATLMHDATQLSGAAQYPENGAPPTIMPVPGNTLTPGPRHLAGVDSPTGYPSAYVSNITNTQAIIHMGASPDARNMSTDSYFEISEYLSGSGWWILLTGDLQEGPTFPRTLDLNNQCSMASGQYCFKVLAKLRSDPSQSSGFRYIDLHPGAVAPQPQPHIAAFYNAGEATAILEYAYPGAMTYHVTESHGGATFDSYQGPASQITVNRILGAPSAYKVAADLGNGTVLQSAWIYLHDEVVSIPTATSSPTQTSTPTLTPTPDDTIFADGFESGDLTHWTSSQTGNGNLSVVETAALSGGYGLRAVAGGSALFVQDETPNGETRYRARFLLDPNGLTMSTGSAHYIFMGYMGPGAITPVVRLELGAIAANYLLRGNARNDTGAWQNTTWHLLSDAPHTIEIDWQAAAVGANNGSLTLWLDGVQTTSLAGIDNDTRRIDRIRLGLVGGLDAGTQGVCYFDAFYSRRMAYIGSTLTDALVAYWALDETSGTCADMVGSNHLASTNGVGYGSGIVGNAAHFVWSNSQVLTAPSNSSLSMGDFDFTLAGWAHVEDLAHYLPLLAKWREANGRREYALSYASDLGQFAFFVSSDSYNKFFVSTAPTVGNTPWYFVVAWHDAAHDTLTIQVNDTSSSTIPYSNGVSSGNPTPQPLQIGRMTDVTGLDLFGGGLVDQAGIWKRLLSAEERRMLYNCGTGWAYPFVDPVCSPP